MTENPELKAAKSQLRAAMLEKRARIPERARKLASRDIASSFTGNVPRNSSDVIGGYWPMRGEADITLLLEALAELGHAIALPTIQGKGKPLQFRQWKKGLAMVEHKDYGMMEPPKTMPELAPTLLLVPLLAFDAAGYRLGYGGGYYDRTLAMLAGESRIFTCGIAYNEQQVGSVPHGRHDARLDCVITPRRVLVTGVA